MVSRTFVTALALTAIVAAPVIAQETQRRRTRDAGNQPQPAPRQAERAQPRERAVPRTVEPRAVEQRREEQVRREEQSRRDEQVRREAESRRQANARRDNNRYDNNRYDNGRSDNRRGNAGRYGGRYDNRRYTPRVIRPTIVRVVPYRPYVYRPSYRIGVHYGSGGHYPYGHTPRGYYDPIPGRFYGGVRITGAPRDARVFADGYYVGIVNDFDGIFQHLNLEAGPHHVEIDLGYDAIEFNVYVRPGETTTFRADRY
jgi:hypothetical protein